MLTKKYFSITEAGNMCALPAHKLRYIDKTDKNISIVKIRGRRYYTKENLLYLIKHYSDIEQIDIKPIEKSIISGTTTPPLNEKTIPTDNIEIDHSIIEQIDILLEKFYKLSNRTYLNLKS
jgi:DNA-binding transcriptional MerR regulator